MTTTPLSDPYAELADGAPGVDAAATGLEPSERAGLQLLADVARAFRSIERPVPAAREAAFRWGPLEVFEPLGSGGQASVYRAFDPWIEREVALKLFAPGTHATVALDEARHLARVRHPNLLLVHGAALHEGRAGLWSEHIEGRSLRALLREEGTFGVVEALRIAGDLAGALAAIHAAGLVHGDVKPDNAMREHGGRVVLMDFGAGGETHRLDARLALTGTARYLPPEVLDGGAVTPAADVYALGVLLWELIHGQPPYPGQDIDALRAAQAGPPPISNRADLDPALLDALRRLIAPDPAQRPRDAAALRDVLHGLLRAALPPPAVAAPPRQAPGQARWWRGIAVAALALLAVVAWFGHPSSAPPALDAQLLRIGVDGEQVLADGDVLHERARLRLRLRGAAPMWVYLLNEDASGIATVLYPQAGAANPLTPDTGLILPASAGDRALAWEVGPAAGVEEFVLIAAAAGLPVLERELSAWRRSGNERAAGTLVAGSAPTMISGETLRAALATLPPEAKVQVRQWRFARER